MTDMVELRRGKTKIVRVSRSDPSKGEFEALDVVTWNNDRSEPMPRKGKWSTDTTVAMFELLREAGIGVAFTRQSGPHTFQGPICTMYPLEVIVRDSVDLHSSYLKRHPRQQPGTRFEVPAVEFFLKTDTAEFNGIELPDIDPFIGHIAESGIVVYHPKKPIADGVHLGADILGWDTDGIWPFEELESVAREAFIIARDAWKKFGYTLKDWKVEFGVDADGKVLLADVIDNDSWRIEGATGREYSKQNVRNGMNLEAAAADYQHIAHAACIVLALSRRPAAS